MRLSSHQVSLLLSSIWAQATSQENTPTNYEAMAHTYNLALSFSQTKVSFFLGIWLFVQLTVLLYFS